MSRHPEPFEKHGITTRTLERAPLAREAFYTSDWPGARALVQSTDDSKVSRAKHGLLLYGAARMMPVRYYDINTGVA